MKSVSEWSEFTPGEALHGEPLWEEESGLRTVKSRRKPCPEF